MMMMMMIVIKSENLLNVFIGQIRIENDRKHLSLRKKNNG